MSNSEKISTRHGDLEVEKAVQGEHLVMTLSAHLDQGCLFHWGLARDPKGVVER